MLDRWGFQLNIDYLEENYDTPVPMNTATYLKNVHSDFGFAGILLFPYALGALTTFLTFRLGRKPTLPDLMLLSNLFLLVLASPAVNLTVLGDWYISLVVSCIAGLLVQRRSAGMAVVRKVFPVDPPKPRPAGASAYTNFHF